MRHLILAALVLLGGCSATHAVVLPMTLSIAPSTCGPLTKSYCGSAVLSPPFVSAKSFNCLGWSVKPAGTAYYHSLVYQPAATVTVAWSDGKTVYVGSDSAAVAGNVITLTCEGL